MSNSISSVNPFTGITISSFQIHSVAEVNAIIQSIEIGQHEFSKTLVVERAAKILNLENLLLRNKNEWAHLISSEMGKPLKQSLAEIDKCAGLCRFYAAEAPLWLQDEIINSEHQKSWVRNDPLGVVLAIMPWNFPFWQTLRCAIPALIGGNAVLLKHASNVFGCALAMEQLFSECKLDSVFKVLKVSSGELDYIIENEKINAVSLTGSVAAGRAVASRAGQHLKKVVLELGGSNSFIVDADANLDALIPEAVLARFQNNGQSCIAAKRFLIHNDVYDRFLEMFTQAVSRLKMGDPLELTTDIGPLARPDFNDELMLQMEASLSMGAKLHYGGKLIQGIFEPTIVVDVGTEMPIFSEETFGPLAAVIRFSDRQEALSLHQTTEFGLGVSIFTENVDAWLPYLGDIDDGAVFFNSMVKSDPRLPFGGTKHSGYGRELSKDGLMEFVNRKTVVLAR